MGWFGRRECIRSDHGYHEWVVDKWKPGRMSCKHCPTGRPIRLPTLIYGYRLKVAFHPDLYDEYDIVRWLILDTPQRQWTPASVAYHLGIKTRLADTILFELWRERAIAATGARRSRRFHAPKTREVTVARKTVIITDAKLAAGSQPQSDVREPAKLRRVEPGLYETPDGRYGVVKTDSVGEWDLVAEGGWAITEGGAKDGVELPGSYRTKRDAAVALAELLDRQEV